ncbi:hypothetical protein SEA_DEXDERT_44 [Gordonia phage Dexdert]|uniref:Uncharacterized protein n=1 Tax=Gordonia phage Dexdert TaxID=2794946 RepID=A0A7T1KS40_9CAUD|nr:hypothetical protein J1597_gp44 [Gordonia phage Dexdert]QPO17041.1 hypothetical protein SEA_DEXDERT_44 [Gordonia phage Dexdert]
MGSCKSCGEHILFAKTSNGKSIPLDDQPNLTKGNVHIVQDGPKILATVLGAADAAAAREKGEQLYLPHFATCPFAGRHRRNR